MPKRALVEHRPWLAASVLAAVAYYFLRSEPLSDGLLVSLKGASAALLAVYAWQRCKVRDAKILTLVMALSALGDVLIEYSLEYGGGAFFLSHLAAMTLYLGNRREHPTSSQKTAAGALLILTPLVCWLLSRDLGITFYGLALGGMAATAWMSRFSRYRVGLGALLFVVSDWLIFARIGYPSGAAIYALLIWPLYYAGQFLIATGVVQTLRKELDAED